MTEQGVGVHRFRLDLEVNDEEEPDLIDRWIEGLGVQHLGEQPFRVGGNFPTHRFSSDDPDQLLALAHRWVGVGTDAHNPDAWEMVEITEQSTDQVLDLRVDAGSPNRGWRDRRVFTDKARMLIERHPATQPEDGRFNLLNFSVRVTAPIGWTDEESGEESDQIGATLRSYLEEFKSVTEQGHPDVRVEFKS